MGTELGSKIKNCPLRSYLILIIYVFLIYAICNDVHFTHIYLFRTLLILLLKISHHTFYTYNCGNLAFLHVFSMTDS